jgi:hypothetical protein
MSAWVTLSVSLYLLPILLYVVARLAPGRPMAVVALDIPSGVAVDLISILLIARFVTLETAVLVSRSVWLVLAPFILSRRRTAIGSWIKSSNPRAWAIAAAGTLLAVMLSRTMSVPYSVWDRQWHIPLVTSMRGERAPFWNVYEYGTRRLYYHYAGDALAAVFQTLSFAHMHSSNALSRAHDVMFGLTGLFLGLVLPSFGHRRWLSVVGVTLATLLGGPATILREGDARAQMGQSITNLLTLSFRPHVSLSYLLILGFVVAVLLPVIAKREISVHSARAPLVAITALLMLTDETSLALLGLMAGAVWLLNPGALGRTRLEGGMFLALLLTTMAAVVLILGGSFSRGAPHQALASVPWQVPGFYQPAVPLSQANGCRLLAIDLLTVFATLALGVVTVIESRTRAMATTFAAYVTVAVVSLVCLTHLTVNGDGLECHRFVTASLVISPLFAFYWIGVPHGASLAGARSLAPGLAFVALAPPVASTVEWLVGPAEAALEAHKGFWGNDNFYETDCRLRTSARMGESTRSVYASHDIWYLYAGCRPLYAPGPNQGLDNHALVISWPELGRDGLRTFDKWMRPQDTLPVYCPAKAPQDSDVVCATVRQQNSCRPMTDALDECSLSPDARRDLSGRRVSLLASPSNRGASSE